MLGRPALTGFGWLAATFGSAACLNLVEAVASPDGWAWTAVRAVAGAAFLAALLWWMVSLLRRAGPR
jgi:hypothetical protein